MPTPVFAAGSPGNLINGVSAAKSTTIAAFLDLSTAFEGQLTCEVTTGATAPTSGTTFSASKVYGGGIANTLSAAATAGATSIQVTSAAGLHPGQKILLQQAGGLKLGELVTIGASGISGSGPYTVSISATLNNYSIGDSLFLVNQSTPNVVTPSASWAASSDYSAPMILGTGQWAVAASNSDTAQAVIVTVSVDKITAYQ